jgi:hypothetical protein
MIELDGCHTPARLRLPYDGSEDPLVGKWSGDGVLRLSQNGVLPHHTTDNQPLSMRATATVTTRAAVHLFVCGKAAEFQRLGNVMLD